MKKFFATVLAAAMCLSLVACSGGDTKSPAQSGDASSAGSAAIQIGGIGPLTGGAAVYGMATKQGAEVAVAEINAMNGLLWAVCS